MELLKVRVVSPKNVIFYGDATSVSSKNSAGKFDILPEHANFITLIQNEPIYIRTPDKKTLQYQFPLAIIYSINNLLTIYTEIDSTTQLH